MPTKFNINIILFFKNQQPDKKSNYSNGNSYNNNIPPSRTIMLRNLPIQLDDTELLTELNMLMVAYKDVRLIKNRETGISRGFAFIDFNTIEEAQRWMSLTQVNRNKYFFYT